jgi:glycosyltransferase involved in cell wall biosynthesis
LFILYPGKIMTAGKNSFAEKWWFAKKRVLRKSRSIGEWLRYRLKRQTCDLRFDIVTCERNAREFALKCLDSVYGQDYDPGRVRHIFIDDASEDGTPELIETWLKSHPGNRVEFVHNRSRLGGTANTLTGFRMASPGAIVVELNGDDWLADRGVLSFLNRVYADPDVWMTYNTPRYVSGPPALWAGRIPQEIVATNAFRDMGGWISSHPHTFRRELFDHVHEEALLDPETGAFWESADDQAIYLAMLELAGGHSRHLHRALYVYNFHEQSHAYGDGAGSEARARRIRQQPKYRPLESL